MLRPRILAALVVAGAGLATAIWLPTRHDTARAADRTDTPVEEFAFSDDFDAPAGAPLDALRWRLQAGPAGRQRDATRGAVQDGRGHLIVSAPAPAAPDRRCRDQRCSRREARPADTSTRLSTAGLFSQRYGRVETSLRLPREVAMRAKLALVADAEDGTSAEISAVETDGNTPRRVYAGLRGPEHTGDDAILGTHEDSDGFWHDFHTFVVDWSPNQIVWSVDGVDFLHATPETIEGAPWVYERPAHLVLDLTAPGTLNPPDRRPESEPAESEAGRDIAVDYVRVTAFEGESDEPPGGGTPGDEPGEKPPTTPPTTAPTTAPPTTPPATTPPPVAKPWVAYTNYLAGQLVTYQGKTYEVQQAHTSLPGWEPPNVPALFVVK